jgi:hypothetical protein
MEILRKIDVKQIVMGVLGVAKISQQKTGCSKKKQIRKKNAV